jgi:hypothetical protein
MKNLFFIMLVLLCSVFFVSCGNNTVINISSTNTPENTMPMETPQEPTGSSAAQISKIDMIYGRWKILDMVGEGYIYGDFSMEDYIGGIVTIQKSYIESNLPLGKKKLENPKYKLTKQNKHDFWEYRHADINNGFGFSGNQIKLIEVFDGNDEWDEFAGFFWIRDKKHLIFLGPVYFLAEKVE